ncbi:MAG: hypothetical protein NC048_04620 [Bacteroides sp.]|nr:hypothetical protein [Ruminococcus flavefaciens]MCM1554759.1 hypothetical protein [Bacteroides sp.]
MKPIYIRIITLLLWAMASMPVLAQRNNPLGKTKEEFAANLPAYLIADPNIERDRKPEITLAANEYLAFYATLPGKLQEEVASIAQQSYTARLAAYPDLLAFLRVQQKMHTGHRAAQSEWLEALRQMLKKSRARHFKTLVDKTEALLSQHQLYKSNAAHWKVSNTDFSFQRNPEATFTFANIDLSCRAYQDSTFIYGTSGKYFPMADRFEGRNGEVYWTRSGFSPDSCRTKLISYSVNLKQGGYEAKEAELLNRYLFPTPLRGHFTERLVASGQARQSNYPQFVSESSELSIKGIFPGMDIVGPFVQQGSKTHFGSGERLAHLYVYEEGVLRGKVIANRFILEQGRLSGPESHFVFYLENDSIYNPAVSVRFDAKTRVMHVEPMEKYGLDIPFIDTYHNLRMDFEALRWYLDRKKIEIGLLNMPGRVGVVSFKSLQLYSREELGKLMMGTDQNPLYALYSLSRKGRVTELHLDDVANGLGLSPTQALALLRNPIAFGFVSYDPGLKKLNLLPRLFHNLDVSAGKADFDEIEFTTSENGIVKAVLRTDSLDIRMTGVSHVHMSTKQNVYLQPVDSVVEIFKNRDFHFNGFLHAGTFNFEVRGARFYYDDYKIDIADVKRLGLEVVRMEDGEEKRHPVSSLIRSLTGTVYIDNPANKGGKKDFPEYPIFESTQPAYVYYDDADIQQGAYKPDSFYFKVDPFKMEKLNTVEVDSIKFKGTLVSAGIFPDIRESLVIRPDFSLGFATPTPENGWPSYHGKALFTGQVSLDRGGLQGAGSFDFLASHAESKHLVFLPSKMKMKAKRFNLKENGNASVSYPEIRGGGVNCVFVKNSSLYEVSSVKDSLLDCFAGPWVLAGKYSFSESVSRAEGVFFKKGEARLASPRFEVRSRGFSSDSGDFRLQSGPGADFLKSQDYALQVDLDAQKGDFRSIDGSSPLEFGLHQYEGRASGIVWNMRNKTVDMSHGSPISPERALALDTLKTGDLFTAVLPGEDFVSTRRAQEGLHFSATASHLSYADSVLTFNGVRRILVADALFVPHQGSVTVEKGGQLRSFADAKLYFGDRQRLHAFHHVRGSILSAKQYRVSGVFDYVAPDIEVQPVYFAGIRPMREGYSQASARISADSGALLLNEAFQFIGRITLNAQQTYPYFAGSARMVYACDFSNAPRTQDNYRYEEPVREEEPEAETADYDDFEYVSDDTKVRSSKKQVEEPEEDLFADVEDEPEPEAKKPDTHSKRGKKKDADEPVPGKEAANLKAGNPFLADGIQFEGLVNPDSVLIPVTAQTRSTVGQLLGCGFYTKPRPRSGAPEFLFMRRKLSTQIPNISAAGWLNFSKPERSYRVFDSTGHEALSVGVNACFARATGNINLQLNTYEFRPSFYGDMMTSAQDGKVSVRALAVFDFYLTPEVCKQIATIFNMQPQLESAEPSRRTHLMRYLEEKADRRELERVRNELKLTGYMGRIPEPLSKALAFSEISFDWHSSNNAYLGSGKAELLAVGGNAVNKKVNTYISLRRTKREGDVVEIYMEAASNAWVYFRHSNHYMQLISSSDALNNHITQLKPGARKKNGYEFYLSKTSQKNTFVNSFRMREEYEY